MRTSSLMRRMRSMMRRRSRILMLVEEIPSRRLPMLRRRSSHHLSLIFLQPPNGGFGASGGIHWHACGLRSPIRAHGLHRGESLLFLRFLGPPGGAGASTDSEGGGTGYVGSPEVRGAPVDERATLAPAEVHSTDGGAFMLLSGQSGWLLIFPIL